MRNKPHVKDLHCFPQVESVIGTYRAQVELFRVLNSGIVFENRDDVNVCFSWTESPQKADFWYNIYKGVNPYESM